MCIKAGLEINFFTHSQNFASASNIYLLKMESLVARIEIKIWPEHTIIYGSLVSLLQ